MLREQEECDGECIDKQTLRCCDDGGIPVVYPARACCPDEVILLGFRRGFVDLAREMDVLLDDRNSAVLESALFPSMDAELKCVGGQLHCVAELVA